MIYLAPRLPRTFPHRQPRQLMPNHPQQGSPPMRRPSHALAAVSHLFGDDLPGCSVRVAIHVSAAANRGIRARQLSVALVGILMSEPVARNAILARDAAGAHHLVVMTFPFGELALGIAGARGTRRAEGLCQIEQRRCSGVRIGSTRSRPPFAP